MDMVKKVAFALVLVLVGYVVAKKTQLSLPVIG